jgi:hypothetical protein
MMFKEVSNVYAKNYVKRINRLCEQIAELLIDKAVKHIVNTRL